MYLFDQLEIHSRLLVPGLMGLVLRGYFEWIDIFIVRSTKYSPDILKISDPYSLDFHADRCYWSFHEQFKIHHSNVTSSGKIAVFI